MVDGIYGFTTSETRWLSNFWPASVYYEGVNYPSSEHAYQAAKSLNQTDRVCIAQLTAGQAKRAGQGLTIRPDWEEVKESVMEDILRIKFSHPDLQKKLLETDTLYLEETNTWGDTYWGVCRGAGQNKLGHILMKIRTELENSS